MSIGEEWDGLSLRPSLLFLQGMVRRGEVEYFDGSFESAVHSGGMVRWEEVERGRRKVPLCGVVACGAIWCSR